MSGAVTATRPSYRERQRDQLRADLQRAALELFARDGFDNVTTEAIAAQVGVSLSTFFRHVPSKDELLTGALLRGRRVVLEQCAARPDDEPVTRSLTEAILYRTRQFADEDELMELWRASMASAPATVQRISFIGREERLELISLVARRLGTDSVVDLRPGVLVQVMLAAAEHAYECWLGGSARSLHALTADALAIAASLT